jgi:SOS response regulatory protein OraA/RecX
VKKRPAVLHFIDEEREKGATDQQIRHKLLDAGWHMDIIHRAMHDREDQTAHKRAGKGQQKPVWQRINPMILIASGLVVIVLLALFV